MRSRHLAARVAIALVAAQMIVACSGRADDFGPEGRASTTHELDALQIAHTGPTGMVAHATDAGLNSMDDLEARAG